MWAGVLRGGAKRPWGGVVRWAVQGITAEGKGRGSQGLA